MQEKTKPKSPLMSGAAFDAKEVRAAIKTQTESALRTQTTLLDSFELFTNAWVERRREANQATLETWSRICECEDPAEASAAYNEWISGSIDRMVAGSRFASEQTLKMFQQMMELLEQEGAAKKTNVHDMARKDEIARKETSAHDIARKETSAHDIARKETPAPESEKPARTVHRAAS